MDKVIISVFGPDRPGIIATVSRILFDRNCNIENVRQTILQSEFTGVFIAGIPEDLSPDALYIHLEDGLQPLNLRVFLKPLEQKPPDPAFADSEPFIITTKGPDQKGLVAAITEIIADFGVNVANLQAIFEGGDDPDKNIMIYEVDIPKHTDQSSLRKDLGKKAEELGLTISFQHRNIFMAINRI